MNGECRIAAFCGSGRSILFGVGVLRLALILCFAVAQVSFAASWWDPQWRCMRRVAADSPIYRRSGRAAVHVEFTTAGYLQAGGEDIRVLAGEKIVPHHIVFVGPGDRVSLLFEYLSGRKGYQIYYGNPACKAMNTKWTPQRGLIMETRRFRGGGVRNWKEFQATLKAARPVYGRGLVDKVWHGHNPFGPSRNIVTTYTGWLNVVKGGAYDLITSSASASFLFLDDKLIVQWPGWHRAVADARIKKRITLKPGLHKFGYYHVQGNADPIMVAAWRQPGRKKPEVIHPAAFIPPLKGRLTEYRIRGVGFATDFSWRNAGEALFKGRYAVTMRFTDTSYPRTSRGTRREWNFGDGLTSKEFQPAHVYLATGTYDVTLKIFRSGKTYACRQKVVVDRNWAEQQTLKLESPAAVAAKIDRYSFQDMAARPLLGAVMLYEKLDRIGRMRRVGNTLVKKLGDLPETDIVEAAVALGRAWRDKAGKPETALSIFRRAETLLKQHKHRARVAMLAGDTLFYHLGKLASARAEYMRVGKEYADATEYVRLSLMRLGDIARRLGRLEEARLYYRRSLEKRTRRPAGREAMDCALRALETEDFLRRGELEAVEESLHLWQWQEPEEKLRGHWSVMKIRLALKKNDLSEAVKEAETLLRVNPESQYAPEILLLLSATRMKQTDFDKARAPLERLKKEYPDSPLVKEAERRLLTIGAKGAKP